MAFFDFLRRKPAADTLLADLAAKLPELDNLTAANRHIESLTPQHPALVRRGNNVYQYRDCMVNVGLAPALSAHAAGLQRVRDWGLSCAPELIAFSRLRDPLHCVLITRIPGMTDQPPVPWDMRPIGMPGQEDFARVMADAEMLFSKHMVNAAMLERHAWHVLPSGRIIISDWSSLLDLPEKWEEKYRQQIKAFCDL